MTEPEVIEKLTQFKEKLLKFRDERNAARDELATVQSTLSEKDQTIENLMNEKTDALAQVEEIHKSLDNFQKLLEELTSKYNQKDAEYKHLKEITYKTVKHLVEDNIEVKEVEISDLNAKVEELLAKIEVLNTEKDNITGSSISLNEHNAEIEKIKAEYEEKLKVEPDLEKYIKIETHKAEINKILEEKEKSDNEKQTVLSNTWKTQIETSRELTEKTQELAFKEEELRTTREDFESVKKSLDDKIAEFDNLKATTDAKIKELENAASKIDNDTQLSISRLTEKVNSLTGVKSELEKTNSELLEKIKLLEQKLANAVKPITSTTERILANTQTIEKNTISKETIPYKFGSTTASVMQKAKNFVEELYNDCVQIGDKYILNNPKEVATKIGLTEKEYTVFMNRFCDCLEYDGVPLLYEEDNSWKSNLSKVKLIDFISTISGR